MSEHSTPQELPPITTRLEDRRSLADTGLRKFFEAAVKYESSDLIMRGGLAPKLRLKGSLKALDAPLSIEDFEKWIEAGLTDAQWRRYTDQGSFDLGVDFDFGEIGLHRFRVNIFRTRGRSAIAARRVSSKILKLEDLFLPPALYKVAEVTQGLVLIAGVTGSGKSTTLASMLQHVNETRSSHILTIEDPIEYLFSDAKSIINQREVNIDVPTFSVALRAMVRENPDVVLIGEMRDKETFEAALQAAETGHLVFGTIHASSASQAFGRIYDLFPQEEREPIRNMLAYQIQAFVYQKLIPSIKEGVQRVPAVEILLQSPVTRKYILDGREHELAAVIREARESGMQSFTDSLVELVQKQYIHPRSAVAAALNPEEVKMRLKGISATSSSM